MPFKKNWFDKVRALWSFAILLFAFQATHPMQVQTKLPRPDCCGVDAVLLLWIQVKGNWGWVPFKVEGGRPTNGSQATSPAQRFRLCINNQPANYPAIIKWAPQTSRNYLLLKRESQKTNRYAKPVIESSITKLFIYFSGLSSFKLRKLIFPPFFLVKSFERF